MPAAKAATAYDSITRSVRRSILVTRVLAEPLKTTKRVAARKQIIREVEDTIQREAEAEDADTLNVNCSTAWTRWTWKTRSVTARSKKSSPTSFVTSASPPDPAATRGNGAPRPPSPCSAPAPPGNPVRPTKRPVSSPNRRHRRPCTGSTTLKCTRRRVHSEYSPLPNLKWLPKGQPSNSYPILARACRTTLDVTARCSAEEATAGHDGPWA